MRGNLSLRLPNVRGLRLIFFFVRTCNVNLILLRILTRSWGATAHPPFLRLCSSVCDTKGPLQLKYENTQNSHNNSEYRITVIFYRILYRNCSSEPPTALIQTRKNIQRTKSLSWKSYHILYYIRGKMIRGKAANLKHTWIVIRNTRPTP